MKVRDIGSTKFGTTGGARTSSSTVAGGMAASASGMLLGSTAGSGFGKQGSKSTVIPKKPKQAFNNTQ